MVAGRVVVFGAGAMGSALATPLRARGWDVRLWGTWLDDDLLAACKLGGVHPRTGSLLARGTALFASSQVEAAMDGADLGILAVASVGVESVTKVIASAAHRLPPILLTSKGFTRTPGGEVCLLPDALRNVCEAAGVEAPPVIGVGGPCKANEVAAGRPTVAIYAGSDREQVEAIAAAVASRTYKVRVSTDVRGIEMAAAMKNVYAIGLGIADGLGERDGEPWHNLKAAIFAQAIREIGLLCEVAGGLPVAATGLAGVGDLEVTGLSGRNKVFGSRIGRGQAVQAALDSMAQANQTVEGAPACELAASFVDQQRAALWADLPLLRAISSILQGGPDPGDVLSEAILSSL